MGEKTKKQVRCQKKPPTSKKGVIESTPNIIKRLAKYTFFSSSAFWFDLALIYLLAEFLEVQYLLATTLAFTIAHSLNYSLNAKWNFKESKQTKKKSYTSFMVFGFFSLFLILSSLATAVEFFGINYLWGRVIIALFVGGINFIYNYFISFKMTPYLKKDFGIQK